MVNLWVIIPSDSIGTHSLTTFVNRWYHLLMVSMSCKMCFTFLDVFRQILLRWAVYMMKGDSSKIPFLWKCEQLNSMINLQIMFRSRTELRQLSPIVSWELGKWPRDESILNWSSVWAVYHHIYVWTWWYFKSNILYVFRFAVLTLIYAGSSIDDSPLINDAGDIRFHMNDSPVIWKRWLLLNAIHAEEINQIIFCLLRVLGVDDNSVYQAAPCWMNGIVVKIRSAVFVVDEATGLRN